MNIDEYKISFTKEAENNGFSASLINECLNYASFLINANLPVIYNTTHLSALVGYKKKYIKKAITYTTYYYRDFSIRKKSGTLRHISEPLPSLKEIQYWILHNILENVPISKYAKAYKKGSKLYDNVKYHKGSLKVLTIDIRNFFPSISRLKVKSIFEDLGYTLSLADVLSKLCTRDEELPQGAPTSPNLSNIYMNRVDELLSTYCFKNKIRYTRYADDLTFSGNFDEYQLKELVVRILNSFDLYTNEAKCKCMYQNERQIVTGIVVNKKTQVPFEYRNNLRKEMYFILKFGLENHMKRRKITQENYLKYLIGKVAYVLSFNTEDKEFIKYYDALQELSKNNKII